MTAPRIEVDAAALRQLLAALNGQPHEIRELQAIRTPLLGSNPIDKLIGEFNDWCLSAVREQAAKQQAEPPVPPANTEPDIWRNERIRLAFADWSYSSTPFRAKHSNEDESTLNWLEQAYRAGYDTGQTAAPVIRWPKAKDVSRLHDMGDGGCLHVGLDADSDVYVSIHDNERAGPTVEFCAPGAGGGRSSRTRLALIALMVAMEADNAASPDLDWRALRAAKAQKQPKGN